MATTGRPARATSPNQLLGYVFGAVYLVVGLVGFAVTSGVSFAGQHGKDLIIFAVNPLHNIVHLAIGILLLAAAARGAASARGANILVGAVYLLVGILGLFVLHNKANIIALNGADNVLHLASAVLLLGVGLFGERRATTGAGVRATA